MATKAKILQAIRNARAAFKDAIYGKDVRQGLVDVADSVYDAVNQWGALIDDTLTQEGEAADAKTVGDRSILARTILATSPLVTTDSQNRKVLNLDNVLTPGCYVLENQIDVISSSSDDLPASARPSTFKPSGLIVEQFGSETNDNRFVTQKIYVAERTSGAYSKITFFRMKGSFNSPWSEWFDLYNDERSMAARAIYSTSPLVTTDSQNRKVLNLDDVLVPGYYILDYSIDIITSSSDDLPASEKPSTLRPTGLIVEQFGAAINDNRYLTQKIFKADANNGVYSKNTYFRMKGSLSSAWSEWFDIYSGGTVYNVTRNITEVTATNSYDISVTPQTAIGLVPEDAESDFLAAIESMLNSLGWLMPSNGDSLGAIQYMLNTTGYCHLSEGEFHISGGITIPENAELVGCGQATKIILDAEAGSTQFAVRLMPEATLKDINITCGGSSYVISETPGNKIGVYYTKNSGDTTTYKPTRIENVVISNFDNSGLYCANTGTQTNGGLLMSDCYIHDCCYGINIIESTEYSHFTNITIANCYIGCQNNGGNNVFASCVFGGEISFLIDDEDGTRSNNGHGSCVGCAFNHSGINGISGRNNGTAIQLLGVDNGFTFTGCNIWYGLIKVNDCKGVIFDGCLFGNFDKIRFEITNSTSTIFSNGCVKLSSGVDEIPASQRVISGNTALICSNLVNMLTGTQLSL